MPVVPPQNAAVFAELWRCSSAVSWCSWDVQPWKNVHCVFIEALGHCQPPVHQQLRNAEGRGPQQCHWPGETGPGSFLLWEPSQQVLSQHSWWGVGEGPWNLAPAAGSAQQHVLSVAFKRGFGGSGDCSLCLCKGEADGAEYHRMAWVGRGPWRWSNSNPPTFH